MKSAFAPRETASATGAARTSEYNRREFARGPRSRRPVTVMTKLGLVMDSRFQRHDTGHNHPERPERLAAIEAELQRRGLADRCTRLPPRDATNEELLRIHAQGYILRLRRACERGDMFIDVPDSAVCGESFEIARLAAGSAVVAVDAVMSGTVERACALLRPPGHHAERDRSMGFCLFNNIAIAAAHLLEVERLSRVLILDWDVHHGNATQHSFDSDARVLFISLHGHPGVLYPGTGYASERGVGAGEGFTLNIPMLPGADDAAYRAAFETTIAPAVDAFAPEFILVSAGFDAHRADPVGNLALETNTFGWMTDWVTERAGRFCSGRLVSFLEGGYDLDALAESCALHVERMLA